MSDFSDSSSSRWRDRVATVERAWIIAAAIVAILVGLFLLILPSSGLMTVAVLFGVYLVVSGVCTFAFAIARRVRSVGYRWWRAILGILVVAAGVVCLFNLFRSLQVLGFTLGVGLVLIGIADLMNFRQVEARPTVLRVIGGIVTILAGGAMFFVPLISVGIVIAVGSIALILVGIIGLIALPSLSPGRQEGTDSVAGDV